jgi:hypothetical protein
MDRQARTRDTVLRVVKSREMTGRSQTLPYVSGGRRGKDDKQSKCIGPVAFSEATFRKCIVSERKDVEQCIFVFVQYY